MIWFLLGILLFGLGLLWLISKFSHRRRLFTEQDRALIINKWQEIERLMENDRAKEAIFEADKLLDHIFRKINLRGETFADRLRSAEKMLFNYQDIWTAHKLRNKLAHEMDWQVSFREAKQAIDIFDQAIRRLITF